jgi:alpha-glucuronidase
LADREEQTKMHTQRPRPLLGLVPRLVLICQFAVAACAHADDGYRLWLRYDPLPADRSAAYRSRIAGVAVEGQSPAARAIRVELVEGLRGLLGQAIGEAADPARDGVVIAGTPQSSPLIAKLGWDRELHDLGPEGFVIRSVHRDGHVRSTVIASAGDRGALYGAFHFLRLLQTLRPIDKLDVRQKPALQLRVLNHWDNLNGTIERGYAGRSLWDWDALPDKVDPRLRDYARAKASIGINGSVLNNVNASAKSLSPEYLRKTAAIADAFRQYGVRVYLAARFSAPIELGGLKTADPLDADVKAWWAKKADEIYQLIPDFGGLLVKANSEGQPGPRTYNRSHADGANMLAAALAPHHGVVI